MNLDYLFDIFIQDRKVYCSPETVYYYSFYLTRFLSWLKSSEYDDISKQCLKSYILYLRDETLMKNTSLHTCYRAVKVFVRWLYQEDYVDTDYTVGVRLPRQDPEIVIPLKALEVNQIDQAIINQELSLRNYCIFHLMLDCGLRRQEVINLKHDFQSDRLYLHNSKGEKSRIVLLPKFLYLSLRNYYNESHDKVGKYSGEYVFLNNHDSDRITTESIDLFFQKLKLSSGVSRVHAHLCRHTFATSYLQYGGDMEKLRLLMGHSDYNVLRNYLHLSLVYPNVYRIDDIFFR